MSHTLAHNQLLAAARSISRRDFIKAIGAAAVGGAMLAIGGRLLAPRLPEVPGETLMRSTFAGLLGEKFRAYQPDATALTFQLVAVRGLPNAPLLRGPAHDEQSFTLIFRGPQGQSLDQGFFAFEHVRIGSFPLFIVPTASDQEDRQYAAIFNRL